MSLYHIGVAIAAADDNSNWRNYLAMQTFERATFTTNRAMEFFTEKELQMRIGYSKELWPIVILKELVDNALDACENSGIQPSISITLDSDSLSVLDNGPGLPAATLEHSLDYMVRVSDKSHYVSPSRGQLGNALKCLWAAPFVANGEYGCVEVCAAGTDHRIEVTLDQIAQEPRIKHTRQEGIVKNGTFVKMYWAGIASYADESVRASFYELVCKFALFNPHASFTLSLPDLEPFSFDATSPQWTKWLTNSPTSPHWYTPERLRSLIAAHLTQERAGGRAKTVREFVSEFAGLAGTAKQKTVVETAGLTGAYLHDLVVEGDVHFDSVLRLWNAMKNESRAVKPSVLGTIDEKHIGSWVHKNLDCFDQFTRYGKAVRVASDDLPYVLEVAFGIQEDFDVQEDSEASREIVVGLNWSPVLKIPFDELYALFSAFRIDEYDPVVVVVHLACPRLNFTEQGKGKLVLSKDILIDLEKLLKKVSKDWMHLKRNADRSNQVKNREIDRLAKQKEIKFSIKDAAYQSMVSAYMKASANNTLPANARQIMYAARPLVLALTGGNCWKNSSYFTQELLPEFIKENPDLTADWDVLFDARGKLIEPHTGHRIDLGTAEVRKYLWNWHETISEEILVEIDYLYPTQGPCNRFAYALFIEKEGFYPLLERAEIANRYDVAIMSTKGMSVTASRQLVEELSKQNVTVLMLHDFDKPGFSIISSLKSDTRRYKFDAPPKIVDLGLRLTDIEALNLESEYVEYRSKLSPKGNLRESGATQSECDFLVREQVKNGWAGERVELNAMPSDVFIEWLENKFKEVGVNKVVPTAETLKAAYRRVYKYKVVQRAIDKASKTDISNVSIPDDLDKIVKKSVEDTNAPWDLALWEVVRASEHLNEFGEETR